MHSKQLIVNETLVNYIDVNPESRHVFVFLHGWQSSAQAWSGVMERLSTKGVRLVAIDLPGFGGSPLPKSAWGVGEYSELVKDFSQKLGINKIILVGHSFGGRVAIKLSAANPELVSKLVLVDAAGIKNENLFNKLLVLAAKTVKPLFALPLLRNFKTTAYKAIGAVDLAEAGPLKDIFIKTINEDLSEFLPKIQTQTLLIWGGEDTETPLAFGGIMNRLIPNSKLVVLTDAGHFSFIDQPDKFTELIQWLHETI